MKKGISLLLVLIMVFTLFSGCSTGGETPDVSDGSSSTATAAPDGDAEVVTYFCSIGAYLSLLTEEINKWNAGEGKEQGVYIELSSNIDTYDSANEAMLKSGNGADLFDDGYSQAGWVANGWVMDLSTIPELADLIKGYEPYLVDGVNYHQGKLVCMPLEILPIKMAVNTDLFEANNLELPTTWADVVEDARIITENGGGVDFGYGWTDAGWSPYGWRRLAMKAFMNNTGVGWFDNNTGTYDFNPFKDIIEIHAQLYQDGSIFPDPSEISIDGIRAQFAAGHVGMIVAPAYDISVYNVQFPATCNWTIIDCPTISGTQSQYKGVMLLRGGCSINASVSEEHLPAVAKAFAFLNSDELNATLYANCGIIPVKAEVRENTEITNPLKNWDIMSNCEGYGYINMTPDGLLSVEGDTYAQVFEAIMNGSTTWDAEIDGLNQRYNDAYQAGLADGTIDASEYEYSYSLAR